MQFRKLLFLSLVASMLFCYGCKKAIDNVKEDLMINLITSHDWKVVRFLEGSSNLTAKYSVYDFKFTKSNTVNAVLDGVIVATGTWVGSEPNQSITATFPGSDAPLDKLSGVWLITNTKSKPWRVFSHRFEDTKELVLDLQEK